MNVLVGSGGEVFVEGGNVCLLVDGFVVTNTIDRLQLKHDILHTRESHLSGYTITIGKECVIIGNKQFAVTVDKDCLLKILG